MPGRVVQGKPGYVDRRGPRWNFFTGLTNKVKRIAARVGAKPSNVLPKGKPSRMGKRSRALSERGLPGDAEALTPIECGRENDTVDETDGQG